MELTPIGNRPLCDLKMAPDKNPHKIFFWKVVISDNSSSKKKFNVLAVKQYMKPRHFYYEIFKKLLAFPAAAEYFNVFLTIQFAKLFTISLLGKLLCLGLPSIIPFTYPIAPTKFSVIMKLHTRLERYSNCKH